MKSEVYRTKVGKREEMLDLIMDVIARIQEHKDELWRATRYVLTRGAMYVDADSEIFENVLY